VSTFLQLSQAVHLRIRAGNQTPGSQPTAIPAPAGTEQSALDAITCVAEAWEWVQNQHMSWNWMRKQSSLPLVPGTRVYNLALIRATTADYEWNIPFYAGGQKYCYLYDGGAATRTDQPITCVPYIEWRGYWDRAPRGANAKPAFFTERPDRSIEFDPTPNNTPTAGVWIFAFDYRKSNQALTVSGDTPECPPQYHGLIMWKAIQLFGQMRAATGLLYQTADIEVRNRFNQLAAEELPVFTIDTDYAGGS